MTSSKDRRVRHSVVTMCCFNFHPFDSTWSLRSQIEKVYMIDHILEIQICQNIINPKS